MGIKKTFLRYAIVGVSGTTIDFLVLIFLVEVAGLAPIIANIPAFLLAVLNNYTWNNYWTYKNPAKRHREKLTKFFIVSSVGFGLNELLFFIFSFFPIWYVITKCIIIAIVLVWNFTANTLWTFNVKKTASSE